MKVKATILSLILVVIAEAQGQRDIWQEYKIGLVGDAATNPIFNPIKAGVEKGIHELEIKHKLDITLIDITPRHASAQAQINALNNCYVDDMAGVLLIPSHPALLKPNIDFLVNREIPVVTLLNDVANSMRTAAWIRDEAASARMAINACIRQLAPSGGKIAVLTGDRGNPVHQTRLATALDIITATPQVHLYSTFTCDEDLTSALAVVESALMNDRDQEIDAWLFLGAWPLAGAMPLPWDTQAIPCTAIGALPPMLPYIKRKEVALLVAQDYSRWGYEAMCGLINQIHLNALPKQTVHYGIPSAVTAHNLHTHWDNWVQWYR